VQERWHALCGIVSAMAKKVEELLVYQKSMDGLKAISALIKRSGIRNDWKLRDQLQDAAIGVSRNIHEGFGQQTDRLFVRYLYIARGSAMEVRTHLAAALTLEYISLGNVRSHDAIYEEISKMLTGLIKYLKLSDRRTRG
jgi:four helix bundle protein